MSENIKKTCDLVIKNLNENLKNKVVYFEAVATTYGNVDCVGDVIDKSAFVDTLGSTEIKLLWQHKKDEPIGIVKEFKNSEKELTFIGSMPLDDRLVRDRVLPQLKHGTLDVSIGLRVFKSGFKNRNRVIQSGELIEVSLVSLPADKGAVVNSVVVRSVTDYQDNPLITEISTSWNQEIAIENLKKYTGSIEKPSSSYKDAFLWHDFENPESFNSYKFPIMDAIDGNLKIVPKALFSAAVQLDSIKSDIVFTQEEEKKIESVLVSYYKDLGREDPFLKGFSPTELKIMSKKELKNFLRTRPVLSRAGADYIVNKIYDIEGKGLEKANIEGKGLEKAKGCDFEDISKRLEILHNDIKQKIEG